MVELLQESRERGLDEPAGRSYYTEFHKRLVLPVGCLILTLIGMPLGLQAGPGKKAIGIPIGLFLYIIYYILFTMGRNIATTTSANIVVAMWLPNGLFALLTIVMINRAAQEKPFFPESVHLLYDSLSQAVLQRFYSPVSIDCSKAQGHSKFRKSAWPGMAASTKTCNCVAT